MASSNIYSNVHGANSEFFRRAIERAKEGFSQIYLMSAPWNGKQYSYSYSDGWTLLMPGYPITFVKEKGTSKDFEDYQDDFKEDLSHIVDKFNYSEKLGRKRTWSSLFNVIDAKNEDFNEYLLNARLTDEFEKRKIEVLISLLIGSASQENSISLDVPLNLLDRIKNKIILFDTDQIRFLYQDPDENEKIIKIQGLAGTGKTELLLHKLKDIFLSDEDSILCFTCHNKVLASVLQSRLIEFFNAMGVNRQIDSNKLKCFHAWGSFNDENSGTLSHLCSYYRLPFYSLRDVGNFDRACKRTIENLSCNEQYLKGDKAFTYMFIDESQDFPQSFFDLCEMVTEKRVYIAGDIFQNIFKLAKFDDGNGIHILLNRCYRTEPKTFMFAHGMGMGLFEPQKISWFRKDEEWEKCGYTIEKIENGKKCKLSRKPVRRFEDIPEDFPSTEIYVCKSYLLPIVRKIEEWKDKYDNLTPDDIGIIMIDDEKYIYQEAPILSDYLNKKFGWVSNLAFVTKKRKKGTLFISNRNNVKGLEFPFVVCLSHEIKDSMTYRHTLYTMLSRSHLQSVLILSKLDEELKKSIVKANREITKTGSVTVEVPTSEQISLMEEVELKTGELKLSLEERIDMILEDEEIPELIKPYIKSMLGKSLSNDISDEDLKNRINLIKKASI